MAIKKSVPELKLFGVIGDPENGITAKQFCEELAAIGEVPEIRVRIASDGGSIADGIAIYNALDEFPGKVTTVIDSALSMAGFIALVGDEREMAPNGMLMLHGARTQTEGTESDHAQAMDMLRVGNAAIRNKFKEVTGKQDEEIATMLAGDNWLDAEQALAAGFVTRIGKQKTAHAGAGIARAKQTFPTMPQRLVAMAEGSINPNSKGEEMTTKQAATVKELKAEFPKAKAEWLVAQAEKEVSLEEAKASYMKAMETELEAANAKLKAFEEDAMKKEEEEKEMAAKASAKAKADAEAAAAKTPAAKSGAAPVARASGAAGGQTLTAHARWAEAVEACVARARGDRRRAVMLANRENPGLREEMLEEANA